MRTRLLRALRRLGDRGATGVEYALVLSLLVTVSIGAMQALTDASEDEVANEMDCVSTRPPPPSCQLRAVSTTTTDGSATTSSTVPVSTTTTAAPIPPTVMTWTGQSVNAPPTWRAEATPYLTQNGTPVAGAQITIRVTITDPQIPVTEEITCITDATGRCTAVYTVPTDLGVTIDRVRFTVIDVDSPVPVDSPPNDLAFVRPS